MPLSLGRYMGYLSLSLLLLLVVVGPLRAEPVNDVRVLIDVSGSMKKNDPQNLRVPALRLLVGLMPDATRSGVWTFAQQVNMQVRLGTVDKAWKDMAMQEAGKIHSRGLFTHIEAAVEAATEDWQQPDPRYRRHLILLTDGMVDVDEDDKLDAQSRQRLLNDILPRLERADASVHTIALSNEADSELMSALSGATGGISAQVDSAEKLQRIFLKLFENSVTPDTLPLDDNAFQVDKHVSDFTALVFLAADSPPTVLQTPGGEKWSMDSHPANVSWHHEDGYDLVSVKDPQAGEWHLQAHVDPDNRVMVVTNLRLKVDKLPTTLLAGDEYEVRARLLENGKTVTNANLLQRTTFELSPVAQGKQAEAIRLADDGTAPDALKGDGVYSVGTKALEAGVYELVVRAISSTFEREVRHALTVHASPASIEITRVAAEDPFKIVVRPHVGLIRPESVSMQLQLPDSSSQIIAHADDQSWATEVGAQHAGQQATITLVGMRYDGQAIKAEFSELLTVSDGTRPLGQTGMPAAAVVTEPEQAPPEVQEETAEQEQVEAEPVKKGFNWTMVIILVVVINLLAITGGWFGYRIWKKRQAREQQAVEDKLSV